MAVFGAKMVQKDEIIKKTFQLVYLWFDWLKWLLIIGTITAIAQKTQDRFVLAIMYATYTIFSIYIFLSIYNVLSLIISKLIVAGTYTPINKIDLYRKYERLEFWREPKLWIYKLVMNQGLYIFIIKTTISAFFALTLFNYWLIFLKNVLSKFN